MKGSERTRRNVTTNAPADPHSPAFPKGGAGECNISSVNPAGIKQLSLTHLDEQQRDDVLFELFTSARLETTARVELKVPRRPPEHWYALKNSSRGKRHPRAWLRIRGHLIALTIRVLDEVYDEHGTILGRDDVVRGLEMYAEARLQHLIYVQAPGDPSPSGYFRWAYVTYATLANAVETSADIALWNWRPRQERQQRKAANLVLGQRSRRRATKNTLTNVYLLKGLRQQKPGLTGVQEAQHLGVSIRTLRTLSARLKMLDAADPTFQG